MVVKEIILGAVRTRTPLTVEHFLHSPDTRSETLRVLASSSAAWELMHFGNWSWRLALKVVISSPQGRLKILDDQKIYLLNNPRRGHNRPIDVHEMVKQRLELKK